MDFGSLTDSSPGVNPNNGDALVKDVVASGQQPRALDAEELWRRVEPYLADFGITRTANLTHLDRLGVPVYLAAKPAGRLLSSGCGKGVDSASAELGAVMEAIEQTYWEDARPDVRMASQRELAQGGEAFVDMQSLSTLRHSLWTAETVVAWVALWDLVAGELVWAPAESVSAPEVDAPPRFASALASSNGLASGACLIDAVLAAVFEVVERDGISMAKAAGTTRQVALDDDMMLAHELAERFAKAGVSLRLSDLTTDDVVLPTARAVISDTIEDAGAFVGYGTSIDPEVAMVRAMTEAAQSRCVVISGSRDDIFDMQRRGDRRLRQPRDNPASDSIGALRSDREPTGSASGDLEIAIDQLTSAGFDRVLVHRYSDASDPVAVVRVVVPGLEGFNAFHALPGKRARAAMQASTS